MTDRVSAHVMNKSRLVVKVPPGIPDHLLKQWGEDLAEIVEDRIAPAVAPNQEERHRIHSGLPRRECPFQQFASRPVLTDCQAHHRRQPGGDVLSARGSLHLMNQPSSVGL